MTKLVSKSVATRISRKARVLLLALLSIVLLAFLPALAMSGEPSGAVSSISLLAPQGVKVLVQIPLQGLQTTRMFTQWEHGRNYLYVEQGGEQITAVDITRKDDPRVVGHQPEPITATQYEPADGGPIEVTPQNAVVAGVDNSKDANSLSVLQADDARDAQLLRFFGYNSSNLMDRDRRLVFFASPTRLLILEDNRWYGVDYSIN